MGDCMKSYKRTAANTRGHYKTSSSSSKGSKTGSVSPEVEFLPLHHLNCRRNSASSGADSRSSTNESLDIVKDRFKVVDLELNQARSETDVSTCINGNKFSRENTPSSELRADPEMDSSSKSSCQRRKAPPQSEIDEFFTAAEKYDQKRFAEKYNFDIVKDAPLEGRYQWLRLKQ